MKFQLRDEDAGKKGRCPNKACQAPFRAPTRNNPEPQDSTGTVSGSQAPAVTETAKAKQPSQQKTSRKGQRPPVPVADLFDEFEEFPSPTKSRGPRKPVKPAKSRSKPGLNIPLVGVVTSVSLLLGVSLLLWFRSGGDELSIEGKLAAAEQLDPVTQLDFAQDIKPFFERYCTDCHSNGSQEGDFNFDRYPDLATLVNDRHIWKKVMKLVRIGAMPPPESDLPDEEERDQITKWIDHQLFYVDCSIPIDPGRVTARRLNRSEYNNTVRDLLGVDFKPAADFPSDDVGYGFDNIGDVLSVPPLLIEKYLNAAEQVAEKAIPTTHPNYFKKLARGKDLKNEGSASTRGSTTAIPSRGRVIHNFNFPVDGTYRLRIDAMADQAGDELAKMEVKYRDKVLRTIEINGHKKKNEIAFEFESKAGKHDVSAGFINDFYNPEKKEDRNLYVDFLQVEGPLGIPESLLSEHPLLKVLPGEGVTVGHAASANFREFLPKAFRRPVTEQEVLQYVSLVEMASERGATFERALQVGLQAVLISPHFLFRIEDGLQLIGNTEQLDGYSLASRLSYFLWSSLPDEELLELARANRLHEPDVLRQQTLRMLEDPRADALIENFSGQWLGLRKLVTDEIAPDPEIFPDFNDKLRKDLWKETEHFFGSVVREDRSIYDLLNGRYSFLNERLAKLYGIDGVQGENFRRVEFSNWQRMGVLTHGSVLTLTSYPNRTSPVLRGQWVLENLLNDPPPEAPPVVPDLAETQDANPNLSFREQLELHRSDPGCASCHNLMDAIGFGLENFDAIGRWRTKDGEHDIDSSGTLPSGENFSGPSELITILSSRKTQFGRCLAEKLLIYALGRGTEYYDRCALDAVMAGLEQDDRFSNLVIQIVQSAPFQMRRTFQ